MTKPKTIHITNSFHPTSGGISTFYRALMRAAAREQRHIRLIVPSDRTGTEEISPFSRIYHIEANPAPIGDSRYRCLWSWGHSGRAIKAILRAEQPDLIEMADKYTLPYLAGLLRKMWVRGIQRKPILIATSHERMDDALRSYTPLGPGSGLLSRTYLRYFYFPMFDWHVANSEYTAEELFPASVGHRLFREIRVLPMGVDCDAFDPAHRTPEARRGLVEQAGLSPDSKLLLYAGRLSPEKNLDLLADTVNLLDPEYALIVAGAGELRESLERRMNGRARFLGHVQHRDELAALFAAADVFIHPNPREPFGIAPLEAMAAALPVVGPSSGGLLSYARDTNAWLTAPDPKAFASTIRSVFNDPNERNRRTRNARSTAEEFSWPKVAARFFEFFDEAVNRGFPLGSQNPRNG